MNYYSAIDLHSNNSYLVILDENDRIVLDKRLPNDLDRILLALAPYKEHIQGIAVESTYNWYWLVDGLMEAGYQLHLVNTTAVKTYSGLKRANDKDDARWLAHLLRLGILPTGFIYPKEARPLRDRLRKRLQLVQQRTRNILSLKSFYAR
ncbi:IS110 family transposase, partial [Lacimicrobium alkaliphilum]|uniref:IS110 family transposase n=1 Tax=Lacimicrobium alkaliphilum TaxID=1526571 RepID=UPI00166C5D2E